MNEMSLFYISHRWKLFPANGCRWLEAARTPRQVALVISRNVGRAQHGSRAVVQCRTQRRFSSLDASLVAIVRCGVHLTIGRGNRMYLAFVPVA